jgi:hypothetical protein
MSQRYLGGVITANPTAPTLASASGVWTLEQQFQYAQTIQPKIVGNSVRLRASASAYFNRITWTSANRTTWTSSLWIKRGALSSLQTIMGSYDGVSSYASRLYFTAGDALAFDFGGSAANTITTSAVFRDPSAWYHIVLLIDTTQVTAANRIGIYVNGVLQTTTGTPVAQNTNTLFWVTSNNAYFGVRSGSDYLDGYLSEINVINGQALTPSSFGAYDSTGVWQPMSYAGTYGTNGFYLTFADPSAATAAAIGKDYSGNGNNWTPNNISVTAGVTYDAMIDSPTNWVSASGGNGVGNYAVLNSVDTANAGATFSNANLTLTSASTGWKVAHSTIAITSGKWYAEFLHEGGYFQSGVCLVTDTNYSNYLGSVSAGYGYDTSNGFKYNNGSGAAYGATLTNGDIVGVAFDADAGSLTFYKNNTSQGVAYTGLTNAAGYYIAVSKGGGATSVSANFGQRPFTYTPPTGFKALNTANLPAATINNGAQYMAATLYTGNGATGQSILNSANNTIGTTFQPDLVWVKSRSAATDNGLEDSVRGVTKDLNSNNTDAEETRASSITAFNSNGFTLGGNDAVYNASAATYVAWQWKAGGNAASNTSGTITSSVSANTTAGFSIATYTGNGSSSATVGHGLGVTPAMVITKPRSASGDWFVAHISLGNGNLILNQTLQSYNPATQFSGGGLAAPNSSTTFGFVSGSSNASNANANGTTYVAYCFAAVTGYSKFGSYTGNGSADGPFVYLGFRPRWVMVKRTDSTGDWVLWDTSRNTYNAAQAPLFPNLSVAEGNSYFMDALSNGFKLRMSTITNVNGATYIYAAFAENPFNISRAR